MLKIEDETEIDQNAVAATASKLAMLADLFCGTAGGCDFQLSERGLDGLVRLLHECQGVCEDVENAVGARNVQLYKQRAGLPVPANLN
jgi:hypothetical protein